MSMSAMVRVLAILMALSVLAWFVTQKGKTSAESAATVATAVSTSAFASGFPECIR
jgi:hypothetical protein